MASSARRGRGRQRLDADLLRVVGGVERQLVTGARQRAAESEATAQDGEDAEDAQDGPRRMREPERGGERRRPFPGRGADAQALTVGQVLSIQVYVDVGSPFGQPGGAVMLRIGIVMMRFGSRIWNG